MRKTLLVVFNNIVHRSGFLLLLLLLSLSILVALLPTISVNIRYLEQIIQIQEHANYNHFHEPQQSAKQQQQQQQQQQRKLVQADPTQNSTRPPLNSIVQSENQTLIGDPQWLLDFAVIGHGKCGTTTMMAWLADHPEIQCFRDEALELSMGLLPRLVRRLYRQLPEGPYKRGFKNPQDIRIPISLQAFQDHFPQTLLIVGIRHPIKWFQSLYNFKVQNLLPKAPQDYWGDPSLLIGQCSYPSPLWCAGTSKGEFHVHLAMLGKTNNTKKLSQKYPILTKYQFSLPNPVYLFEITQLADNNTERSLQIRKDLKDLVGVKEDFPPPPTHSPGRQWDENFQKRKDKFKIKICDDQFILLRQHLLKLSQEASYWIRNSGFLDNPTVKVSNREHFVNILATEWMKDPCDGDGGKKS